jgi:hypothetical protein
MVLSTKPNFSNARKSASRAQRNFTGYTGALAEPLQIPSMFADESEWAELHETLERKMGLLMRDLGIDPTRAGAFVELAARLAKRHVPGFQKARRSRGRPPEHSDHTLVILTELLTKGYGFSRREASVRIRRNGRIKAANGAPLTADTLRKRYSTAIKDFGPLFENIFARLGKDRFAQVLEASVDNTLPELRTISDSI